MRQNSDRLTELKRQLSLDASDGKDFDDITRLLATSLQVPIVMVNLLDSERDLFQSSIGQLGRASPAATSMCEIFFNTADDLVVVEDTIASPEFAQHPKVLGEPFIRFYAAARLVVNGQTIGTLCACDVQPRQLTDGQMAEMRALANAAMELMSLRLP